MILCVFIPSEIDCEYLGPPLMLNKIPEARTCMHVPFPLTLRLGNQFKTIPEVPLADRLL